jgi:hypothetical protein
MGETYAKDEWIETREKKKAEDAKEVKAYKEYAGW